MICSWLNLQMGNRGYEGPTGKFCVDFWLHRGSWLKGQLYLVPFCCWLIYCLDILHFISPSVNWHRGCFHSLAVMKNAAMNICVQVFVWAPVFSSLGCIPRSGFAELHGNHTFIGEPPNCLPQGMHHFTFPPSMKESSNFCFPFPNFHFHQYLFSGVLFVYLFVFVIISFLVGVVLICIS